MLDASCDTRTCAGTTRLADRATGDHAYSYNLTVDGRFRQPPTAVEAHYKNVMLGTSTISGAPTRCRSVASRRLGDKRLRALAADARKRQRTHAQLATSKGSALNRQSRISLSESHPVGAVTEGRARQRPTAPGHPVAWCVA